MSRNKNYSLQQEAHPLLKFTEAIHNDQRVAKLCRALERHCFDGTEMHCIVDCELHGFEHSITAKTIKAAIERKYKDSIRLDTAVEIVGKLLETEQT